MKRNPKNLEMNEVILCSLFEIALLRAQWRLRFIRNDDLQIALTTWYFTKNKKYELHYEGSMTK